MNNFKVFCLSIHNENLNFIQKNNLIPVGLGNTNFEKNWFTDKTGVNISNKNAFYGEYTFHYWLWKNYLNDLKNKNWIGFCTYRRFWTYKDCNQVSIHELQSNMIKNVRNEWNDAEVILVKKFIIGKIKKSKIIKNFGLKNTILNYNLLFEKKHNLRQHFQIFHGDYYINQAIKLLPKEHRNSFEEYLQNYFFNPFNLFICRNYKILEEYYINIFSWLSKCENKFDMKKLQGYQIRMLAFLAEYYMSYWFNKKFSIFENSITFFDTHKNKYSN